MGYSIGQVAQKTGLSVHTLRYYEKEGLLPFVRKNSSGLRVFSDSDLGWLELIECLKATGLHLKGIKQYIDWYIEGDSTLQQRLDMFKQQKIRIEEQMAELQKHMNKINYKIELYTKAVAAGTLHPEKKIRLSFPLYIKTYKTASCPEAVFLYNIKNRPFGRLSLIDRITSHKYTKLVTYGTIHGLFYYSLHLKIMSQYTKIQGRLK